MERLQLIFLHPNFQSSLKKNKKAEKKRKFCKHDLSHFLDVARIATIMNLEYHLEIDKEIIYACALLHDIGKWQQYENGTPHHEASASLAESICIDCKFSKEETNIILNAILSHRHLEVQSKPNNLNELFYLADKKSRPCYACKKESECNWSQEQKNKFLF